MRICVASSADTPFAEKVGRKARKGPAEVTHPKWYSGFVKEVSDPPKLAETFRLRRLMIYFINCPESHGIFQSVVFFFEESNNQHLGSKKPFLFFGRGQGPKFLEDEKLMVL